MVSKKYSENEIDIEIDYSEKEVDLESVVFPNVYYGIDEETGEEVTKYEETRFIDFLKPFLRSQYIDSLKNVKKKFLKCLNMKDAEYVLVKRFSRQIRSYRKFLDENPETPYREMQMSNLDKLQVRIEDQFSSITGAVAFSKTSLTYDEIGQIVDRLIDKINLSDDIGARDKICDFIITKNLDDITGSVRISCTTYELKSVLNRFKSLGYLDFSDKELAETGFFISKKGKPLNKDDFYNAKCVNKALQNKRDKKIIDSFNPPK
jgi:hypothetical protein